MKGVGRPAPVITCPRCAACINQGKGTYEVALEIIRTTEYYMNRRERAPCCFAGDVPYRKQRGSGIGGSMRGGRGTPSFLTTRFPVAPFYSADLIAVLRRLLSFGTAPTTGAA